MRLQLTTSTTPVEKWQVRSLTGLYIQQNSCKLLIGWAEKHVHPADDAHLMMFIQGIHAEKWNICMFTSKLAQICRF